MKDDDDEDDNTFGVTRYPCMPSLVALQQMRNRLHLAFLGRKLMKWTMMATGRELRKLAMELDDIYHTYADDMRNAFILLARCRYFYPNLNKMVIEDVPRKAGAVVIPITKSIHGVKILSHELRETEAKPYLHLGIEKGGQTILETKKAWLELLRRIILMIQLRTNFEMVEAANKAATKKMNVMKKIIIPRTHVTVSYIISELEEMAREEFHRLKKIKEKKKSKGHKHDKNEGLCPVCIEKRDRAERKEGVAKKVEVRPAPVLREILKEPDRSETSFGTQIGVRSLRGDEEDPNEKLEYLKKHVAEIIVLGKGLIQSGVEHIDIKEFINICESAKAKIEQFFESDGEQSRDNIDKRLEHFKGHIRNVVTIGSEIREQMYLEPNLECFIRKCEEVDTQLNPPPEPVSGKSRLRELNAQIDDVMKITKDYKNQGLLSPSVEAFIKSCNVIKAKIKEYTTKGTKEERIIHLREHVEDLDVITEEVMKGGLETAEIENFSKSCKQFKEKLNKITKLQKKNVQLSNLLEQIDETVDLSMTAKEVGLVGDSIEDFVKSTQKLKHQIGPEEEAKKKVIENLKTNIDDVMAVIDKYINEGLLTDSVEDFLRSCEMAKNKIELYEIRGPPEAKKSEMSQPSCSGNCMICNQPFTLDSEPPDEKDDVCKSCHRKIPKEPSVVLCDSCQDELQELKQPSTQTVCETCTKLNEEIEESDEEDEGVYCEICKQSFQGTHTHEPTPVDSSLGIYVKKIRKLTKVTRTQNPDGTIREEKQTISVRKVRRDPTDTTCDDEVDDDDDDYDDDDDDDDDDIQQVGLCIVGEHNRRGFMNARLTQSETVLKAFPILPAVRSCISAAEISRCEDSTISNIAISIQSYELCDN